MELRRRGIKADLIGFRQFLISMKWTTASDFDLAVVYEAESGRQDLVFSGQSGDPNAFPYIHAFMAEGIGDIGECNEENMRISKLTGIRYLWVLCWDYGKIQEGASACFKSGGISLSVTGANGKEHTVLLNADGNGNVALIATIDNSGADGPRLINNSKTALFKNLKSVAQLIRFIKA